VTTGTGLSPAGDFPDFTRFLMVFQRFGDISVTQVVTLSLSLGSLRGSKYWQRETTRIESIIPHLNAYVPVWVSPDLRVPRSRAQNAACGQSSHRVP
jgi:hypothetical protein